MFKERVRLHQHTAKDLTHVPHFVFWRRFRTSFVQSYSFSPVGVVRLTTELTTRTLGESLKEETRTPRFLILGSIPVQPLRGPNKTKKGSCQLPPGSWDLSLCVLSTLSSAMGTIQKTKERNLVFKPHRCTSHTRLKQQDQPNR